ncbi:MAG: L-histidine N(alpha)-methyltransferase [Planctomycetes bacterium]|nr:L-histidine N(alpha)-methyltransferase [Planctomycetota bacterium]
MQQMVDLRVGALSGFEPGTVVSLGPGDGVQDAMFVQALAGQSDSLLYIPVDISRRLLLESVKNVEPHVAIPVAVHCDFEESEVLPNGLLKFGNPPFLIAMFGGTIGNLDSGVRRFLSRIRKLMDAEDAFLVDVPLAGAAWTPEREPRLKAENYSQTFRSFFQRCSGPACRDTDSDSVTMSFEEQFELSLADDSELNARTIEARNLKTGEVIRNRRFHWPSFLDWVSSSGFRILSESSTLESSDSVFGMGAALLARDC